MAVRSLFVLKKISTFLQDLASTTTCSALKNVEVKPRRWTGRYASIKYSGKSASEYVPKGYGILTKSITPLFPHTLYAYLLKGAARGHRGYT